MTMPPEEVLLTCPDCGDTFTDFVRGSINLMLGDMTEEDVEQNSRSICPHCGAVIQHHVLVVSEKGWRVT